MRAWLGKPPDVMPRRVISILAVAAAALAVAACGGSQRPGTVPVEFGGGNKAAAYCSQRAKGEYTINVNLLGTDADTQRQSLARPLSAGDQSIALMALD